jgi:general secretion pathway protein I
MRPYRRAARGFTLIEVLVALGIVAIALVAGVQATSGLTFNAQRQSDLVLAHLCAENELVRIRLARQMPGIGDTTVQCQQAGRSFDVLVRTMATPNPSFMRVDTQVFDGHASIVRISTVVGRY